MAIFKANQNQASPLPAVNVAWNPADIADLRLTVGDFRLILHALYILQETEIDPLNRRQRIRLGLIAIEIHECLAKSARKRAERI